MNGNEIFKIMLVGDTSTGKTSFLTQLMYRVPERLPKPTTTLSFFTMRISKPATIIQIWDSSGDPKHYYQMLGSITAFNSVLVFIDITNEFTFQRATLLADQLQLYPNLQIHVVLSKVELVQKDPLKRKVSEDMIRKFMRKFRGEVFEYHQERGVEDIVQRVIEWRKEKYVEMGESRKERERVGNKKDTFVKEEVSTPVCDCSLF